MNIVNMGSGKQYDLFPLFLLFVHHLISVDKNIVYRNAGYKTYNTPAH